MEALPERRKYILIGRSTSHWCKFIRSRPQNWRYTWIWWSLRRTSPRRFLKPGHASSCDRWSGICWCLALVDGPRYAVCLVSDASYWRRQTTRRWDHMRTCFSFVSPAVSNTCLSSSRNFWNLSISMTKMQKCMRPLLTISQNTNLLQASQQMLLNGLSEFWRWRYSQISVDATKPTSVILQIPEKRQRKRGLRAKAVIAQVRHRAPKMTRKQAPCWISFLQVTWHDCHRWIRLTMVRSGAGNKTASYCYRLMRRGATRSNQVGSSACQN